MLRFRLILALSAAVLAGPNLAADATYDTLIRGARAGEHGPALEWFKQQTELTPAQRLDQLLISSWAGLDDEVIRLYERHAATLAQEQRAREAVALALRNRQQWDAAAAMYRELATQHPERNDLRRALIMTLADGGETDEALQRSAAWVQDSPKHAEARHARGYALMRAGEQYAALREFDWATRLAPADEWLEDEYLRALQRAGLPLAALERDTSRLSPGERRILEADLLAERVMLSSTATRRESERFILADRALQQADTLLAAWADDESAAAERQRVRIDRLGALYSRVRLTELRIEAEKLMAEGVTLPDYARRWYAGALLYARQPEQAADIYAELVSRSNDRDFYWLADHQGLFYSLVESERLDEARAVSERLLASQPDLVRIPGTNQVRVNDGRVEARSMQADAALFANDLPAAYAAFKSLSDQAPANSNFRVSRALIEQYRGWPRRAEAELKLAETSSPLSLSTLAAQAGNAQALREWARFRELTEHLSEHFPESLRTQRLQRALRIHDMYEFQVDASTGRSRGGSALGDSDLSVETRLYSRPLAEHWRLMVGAGYARGSFQEGDGHHRWQRAGVEWTGRNHRVEADVSRQNYGDGIRTGLRIAAAHDIDDHWQIGWEWAERSFETPLRALNSGVDADLQRIYVRWYGSEQRDWRATITTMGFSDGNRRIATQLDGRERLFTWSRAQLDLAISLASSRNSAPDEGPYFSPESEVGAMATLQHTKILYRRYENVWRQIIQVGLGRYHQKDFGSAAIGMLAYGQRLDLHERLETGFTLSLNSRPYDGQRERDLRLSFDLSYRF